MRRLLVAGTIVAAVGLVSACGSNSSNAAKSGGGSGNAPAAAGSGGALAIAFNSEINGATGSPPITAGVNAAVAAINRSGGVNGHQLKVLQCDNQEAAATDLQCARAAGTNGAFATVIHSEFLPQDAPVYTGEGIIAITNGVNTGDYIPPYYSIDSGYGTVSAAIPAIMTKIGKPKVAVVAVDIAAATGNIATVRKSAAKVPGAHFSGSVTVPLNSTIFSSYAQKLKSLGSDATYFSADFNTDEGIIKAAQQIGLSDEEWVIPSSIVGENQLTQLAPLGPTVLSHIFIVGNAPPFRAQTPAVQQWNSELTAIGDPLSNTLVRTGDGFAAWMSVHLIAKIAASIKGPVTKASFASAFRAVTSISALGLYDWTPNKAGPAGFDRLTDGIVYNIVPKGTQLVPYAPLPQLDALPYVP